MNNFDRGNKIQTSNKNEKDRWIKIPDKIVFFIIFGQFFYPLLDEDIILIFP